MPKVFMLEETGEFRQIHKGEAFHFKQFRSEKEIVVTEYQGSTPTEKSYSVLKPTEYSSNPLEPIMEVWKSEKELIISYSKNWPHCAAGVLARAIQKCMAIVEGMEGKQ